ncbi:MAG: hypothetical protein AAF841_01095 [Pseudomonadota bacterium]
MVQGHLGLLVDLAPTERPVAGYGAARVAEPIYPVNRNGLPDARWC